MSRCSTCFTISPTRTSERFSQTPRPPFRPAGILLADVDQAVRPLERQAAQEDAIDDTEHRRRQPDAEGQRHRSEHGRSRPREKGPETNLDVTPDLFHVCLIRIRVQAG